MHPPIFFPPPPLVLARILVSTICYMNMLKDNLYVWTCGAQKGIINMVARCTTREYCKIKGPSGQIRSARKW